ncbi:class I mannose-6-phosphate isomerase [soil metagenome]
MRQSNYDKFPTTTVPDTAGEACAGWESIGDALRAALRRRSGHTIVFECYPGVLLENVLDRVREMFPGALLINSAAAMLDAGAIEKLLAHETWPADPVFGRMTTRSLSALFDPTRLAGLLRQLESHAGLVVVFGIGASLLSAGDLLVYLDMARWEIQQRQRNHEVDSIGCDDRDRSAWELYKRGFFADWRLADANKRQIFGQVDFFLDTNDRHSPKLAGGDAVRRGLAECALRPIRVVPFFDPGVWGGKWMMEVCDLDRSAPNYAWCFDCVPEENSLLLLIGGQRIELPSINLVHQHPAALLGDDVFARFGAEFPIRFDFLDTIDGGNLSLQVHPLKDYMQNTFGLPYTQDESYYMLDAGNEASVYLGFKDAVNPDAFVAALNRAQSDPASPLDVGKFVNRFPAKKHDHFSIPAGTIHCSGRNAMVLEISATPYIFTFKLWDWGRLDLNGKPRPISISHGQQNLDYTRDTKWTAKYLVNPTQPIAEGAGWREERTGLHASQFIETRRHWFTVPVTHHTNGSVNVINLVEGEAAIVESPSGAFEPFEVHYAETFIVPAAVGEYSIRPKTSQAPCATLKASIRS